MLKEIIIVLFNFLLFFVQVEAFASSCRAKESSSYLNRITKTSENITVSLPEQLVQGINFDPRRRTTHPDFLSTTSLNFELEGDVLGQTLQLKGDELSIKLGSTCSGPCNRREHIPLNCNISLQEDKKIACCGIRVVRFAQFGYIEQPIKMEWLVVMEKGGELDGTLSTTVDEEDNLNYPGKVELVSGMTIFFRMEGNSEIFKLRSRRKPILKGIASNWPPYNMELRLSNGPIKYYREEELDNPKATPVLVVSTTRVVLGSEPSKFFTVFPEAETEIIDDKGNKWINGKIGGVRLSWNDTNQQLDKFKITNYHVYRNLTPGNLEGWELVAILPSETLQWIDPLYSGKENIEYLVLHSIEYLFGYKYEGIYGLPVVVRAIGTDIIPLDIPITDFDVNLICLVELIKFTATVTKTGVFLEWETGAEKNNAGFTLWRGKLLGNKCSGNPNDYEEIVQIAPLLSSKSSLVKGASYSYEDKSKISKGKYCYALEDHDFDGTSTFHTDLIELVTIK